jgi:hypothetical protein
VARSHYLGTISADLPTGMKPLPGATVTVRDPDTGALWTIPLYDSPVNGTPLPNPFLADAEGDVDIWADAPCRVRLEVSYPNYTVDSEEVDLSLPAGSVASEQDVAQAIADHEAEADPHSVYLTQPEASLLYLPLTTWNQPDPLTQYQLESQRGQPSGYAPLDPNGILPTVHLPPLAITDTFVVASESEMLALNAQTGDVCIRSDTSKSYILAGMPPSTLANWKELSAAAPVLSVDGRTGVVDLSDRYVDVAGDTMTGSLLIGGNLTVQDAPVTPSKGYRFRTNGGALDLEGAGAQVFVSVWSNADYTGTQRNKMVLESGADITQAIGQWQWRTTTNGATTASIESATGNIATPGTVTIQGKPVVVSPTAGNILTWDATGLLATLTTANVTVLNRQEFTPTAGATTVTLSSTPNSVLQVARNGVEQSAALGHYSLAGAVLTFTDAFAAGEQVIVLSERGTSVPTDTYTKAESDARFVNVTGDTMTGDLIRDGADLTDRTIQWRTNGVLRWRLGIIDTQAEGAPDTGGDFRLQYYWAAGTPRNLLWADRDLGQLFLAADSGTPAMVVRQDGTAGAGLAIAAGAGTGLYVTNGTALTSDRWQISTNNIRSYLFGESSPRMDIDASGGGITMRATGTSPSATIGTDNGGGLRIYMPNGQAAYPTTTNVTDLGSTSFRWRKLWATDADLSGALTFANDATAKLSRPSAGALRVDTNLGVGVNPEAWNTDARAIRVGNIGALYASATSQYVILADNHYYDAVGNKAITANPAALVMLNAGSLSVQTAPSVAAGAAQTFTTRAVLNTTGTLTLTPDAGQSAVDAKQKISVAMSSATVAGMSMVEWAGTASGYPYGSIRPGLIDIHNSQINVGWNLELDGGGNAVLPGRDNVVYLGYTNARWISAYITNGVTTGSHVDLKQDITPLDPLACAQAVLDTDWVNFTYKPPAPSERPAGVSDEAWAEQRAAQDKLLADTAPTRQQKGYVLGSPDWRVSDLFGLSDRKNRSDGADIGILGAALQQALRDIADLKARLNV